MLDSDWLVGVGQKGMMDTEERDSNIKLPDNGQINVPARYLVTIATETRLTGGAAI